MQGATDVTKVPTQLLAEVLKHIEPAHRLQRCALVSKSWHAAAILATSSIVVSPSGFGLTEAKFTVLSEWLHAHAAAAAVHSLTVRGYLYSHACDLHLQQLTALRRLHLDSMAVAVSDAGTSQHAGAIAELPSQLSALTYLGLRDCQLQLGTLPTFTRLQHLSLELHRNSADSIAAVAAALPQLQRLTSLELGSQQLTQDRVLTGLQRLSALQVLLSSCACTAASFAALPGSLTKLSLGLNSAEILFSPSSTGLTQLSALQWLEVRGSCEFDAALLDNLTSLRHLSLEWDVTLVPAAAGGVGLSVLSRLTHLQHLQLHMAAANLPSEPTDTDIAALTAPSQLTYLDVGEGLVMQQQYACMWPPGRWLPHLHELHATMGLLGSMSDALKLGKGCPNLKVLTLTKALDGEANDDSWDLDDRMEHSIALLADPTLALTSLTLNLTDQRPACPYWYSLAQYTDLRSLELINLNGACFGGIMDLTDCRRLTYLGVGHEDGHYPELILKSPEDIPEVWKRLPAEAMRLVMRYYCDAPMYGYDQQEALASLARATAGHTVALDRQTQHKHKALQQEVADLRATVAAMQQLEQEQQQVVQELQATVSAMQQREIEQQQVVKELHESLAAVMQREQQAQQQQHEVTELRAAVAAMGSQLQALLLQQGQ